MYAHFLINSLPRKCCTCQIRPSFSTCSHFSGVSRRDQVFHPLRPPHLVRQMLTVLQIKHPSGSSHSSGLKGTCRLNGSLYFPTLFFRRTTSNSENASRLPHTRTISSADDVMYDALSTSVKYCECGQFSSPFSSRYSPTLTAIRLARFTGSTSQPSPLNSHLSPLTSHL